MIKSSPRRTEDHPGLPGWLPPYHVPHSSIPFSLQPQNVQGVPRRFFSRSGARPALTALHAPPAVFAFLIEEVKKRSGGGAPVRELVAQTQPPIGIVH